MGAEMEIDEAHGVSLVEHVCVRTCACVHMCVQTCVRACVCARVRVCALCIRARVSAHACFE